MTYDPQNIFAKILRTEIPCKKIYENEWVIAFPDIAPKAPVHILVIPKGAYVDMADFGARASTDEISGFFRAISDIVKEQGLEQAGFRAIANTGQNGGQEVPHFHMHLLGGSRLGPMISK